MCTPSMSQRWKQPRLETTVLDAIRSVQRHCFSIRHAEENENPDYNMTTTIASNVSHPEISLGSPTDRHASREVSSSLQEVEEKKS